MRGSLSDFMYLCLVSNKTTKLMTIITQLLFQPTIHLLFLSFPSYAFRASLNTKRKKGKEIRERMEGKDNKCDFFILASFHSFSLLTQYVVHS